MQQNPDDFFQNQERELVLAIQRQNAFIAELETEIANQALLFFPEFANEKSTITKRLQTELHENILMLNSTIEYLLINEDQNEPINQSEFIIPPKHNFQTKEQELEYELSKSTPPHTPEFIQEMKECIIEERTKREFLFNIHNQIMKTTFNHFPEIIQLNGNSIRNINYTSYTIASLYTAGFYYLISNL